MERSLVYLLIFCCFFLRESLCDTSLSIDSCGFVGETVSLSCTLPPAEFIQSIAWSNDIIVGDISTCTTGGCSPPAEVRYTASADGNGIYMSITSLTRANDETAWNCTLQGQNASTVNLVIRDYPTTCNLTKNIDGSFKCETDCGYPASDLTIDWFTNTTSAVVDLPNPTVDRITTGCTTGGKAYATLPASSITHDGDLYCKCGMQTACPQKALIVSGTEAVTEPTTTTPTSASSICDQCKTTTIRLGIVGLIFVLIAAVICWVLYCQLSGKCSGPLYERAKDGDKEFTTKKLFWSTVIATVLCLLGFVFCLAGVIICGMCEEGVTTSGKVATALNLVIIGFAFALIIMIVEIILLVLVCCRKIKIKDSTCQRATPDGQEGQPPTTTESNIRTETSPRPLRSPTSASKIKTIWKNNQVSDSNESDASNDTPRGKLSGVPANRQLPPLAMTDQVDASQKANQLEPIENTETKKLKKKKKRRSKEEKAQVISGNSDNEQTDTPQVISGNTDNEQTDTNDVLLPNQVGESAPPSCSLPPKVTVQTDHSITRQEPGHEGKEDQTGDSNTNKTHLQDTQGQPNKESKSPDPHEMHENDINQKDRDSDENEHGQNDVKDATRSEYPVKIQSN